MEYDSPNFSLVEYNKSLVWTRLKTCDPFQAKSIKGNETSVPIQN